MGVANLLILVMAASMLLSPSISSAQTVSDRGMKLAKRDLPPMKCQPGDRGCDGKPDTTTMTCEGATSSHCFGAVGINCVGDSLVVLFPDIEHLLLQVGCSGNNCWVNAGSWAHDECCANTPSGRWCNGPNSATNNGCVASWNRAVHRVRNRLGWQRSVNRCTVNNTRLVNFENYCAPAGTIVASNDSNRCCGRASRSFNLASDGPRAVLQGIPLEPVPSYTPVVCVGGTTASGGGSGGSAAKPVWTPETARSCTTGSQCAADEGCTTWEGRSGKICVPQ